MVISWLFHLFLIQAVPLQQHELQQKLDLADHLHLDSKIYSMAYITDLPFLE